MLTCEGALVSSASLSGKEFVSEDKGGGGVILRKVERKDVFGTKHDDAFDAADSDKG